MVPASLPLTVLPEVMLVLVARRLTCKFVLPAAAKLLAVALNDVAVLAAFIALKKDWFVKLVLELVPK
ncbi:hypothetical protein SDC9_170761 [bioreactor metagenome]|uniref:Uncharacterized protein n=1 Tax=bioreactor metagenome TaxID=1076179 RepID=A0A645GI18_9ZZZZ